MAYLVKITPRARRDLAMVFKSIHADNSESALQWYKGLKEALLTLETFPSRCPVTPENLQLRHLLYGRKPHIYRAIYRVLEKAQRVNELHLRHGARRKFTASDLR
jgi:plasmid stabilization system protein ParE